MKTFVIYLIGAILCVLHKYIDNIIISSVILGLGCVICYYTGRLEERKEFLKGIEEFNDRIDENESK